MMETTKYPAHNLFGLLSVNLFGNCLLIINEKRNSGLYFDIYFSNVSGISFTSSGMGVLTIVLVMRVSI